MPNLITQDIATSVSVVATAGQVVFSYPFPVFAASDLRVDLDGSPITSFIVSGVGSSSGGTVTLSNECAAGDVITITRDVPAKRGIDLPATGPVNMEVIDQEFDRVVALIQQLKTRLGVAEVGVSDALDLIGIPGAAGSIAVGTVTTLSPGQPVVVENVGSSNAAIFNFAIPQGDGAGWTTEQLQDAVASMMVPGAGMGIVYDDDGGTLTFTPSNATLASGGFLARQSPGSGQAEALTAAQATALLGVATTVLKGLVPAPGAGKGYAFLRGDLTWAGEETPIIIAASDEISPLTAGDGKVTFRAPFACELVDVRASLTTAQGAGSLLTVDLNVGGASILSTKLTIDNSERTSVTAATPRVVSNAVIANDAELSVDIDQVGDGSAKGLKVMLLVRRTA